MNKVDMINNMVNEIDDTGYQFVVGAEIGLKDLYSDAKEDVEWYTIVMIEFDAELGLGLPIAFLYLKKDNESENIHQKVLSDGSIITYAEIIDSISDRLVIPG